MRSTPSPGDAIQRNLEGTHYTLRDLGNRIAMLTKRVLYLEDVERRDPLVVMTRPAGAVELESPAFTTVVDNVVVALTLDVPDGTDTVVRLYKNGADTGVSVDTAGRIADGFEVSLSPYDRISFYCADVGFTLVVGAWN